MGILAGGVEHPTTRRQRARKKSANPELKNIFFDEASSEIFELISEEEVLTSMTCFAEKEERS